MKIELASFGLIVAVPALFLPLYWSTERDYTFTVESKGRECSGTGESLSCSNFVYGTEGEVFTNSDDLFYLKFDSRSLQSQMHVGERIIVRAVGWRFPLFSMQPNIVSIQGAA